MKILFIGNSHTFMNDMPALVRDMVREVTSEECECVMLAYGGRSLKWHMSEEYFAVRFNILHGGYDYCVMQEVAHPMTSEDDTYANVRKIAELCSTAGTTPVIFETWAEKAMPEHQAEMNTQNDTPKGLQKDTAAITLSRYGKGRVILFSGHPESSGLGRWLRTAARFAAEK